MPFMLYLMYIQVIDIPMNYSLDKKPNIEVESILKGRFRDATICLLTGSQLIVKKVDSEKNRFY